MAGEGPPAHAGTTTARPAIPPKVLAIVVPVIVAGAATFAFALYRYAESSPASPCRSRESAPAA